MKYCIILFSATYFFTQAKAQTPVTDTSNQPKVISAIVGFYNLENLFDTVDNKLINDDEFLPNAPKRYNTNIYFKKINNMASVIAQIGTDVNPDGLALLGVVEIENDTVLTDLVLADKLVERGYQFVHFNSSDPRGIDVGLIYSPKYFAVKSKRSYKIQLPDGHITRDILYVKGMLNGEQVHVFVNHWPSRRGGGTSFDANNKESAYDRSNRGRNQNVSATADDGAVKTNSSKRYMGDAATGAGFNAESVIEDGEESTRYLRLTAAKACRAIIDSVYKTEPEAKIITMGDLNDDPTSPSVLQGLQAMGDVKNISMADSTNATTCHLYNPFIDIFKKGFGTLAYNAKWNLFDQIMFSSPWLKVAESKWVFYKSFIFYRDFLIEKEGRYKGYPHRTWAGDKFIDGYSDHLPVFSILLKQID